ncbi:MULTISPECIES: hypothetical protein [Mesorhizobium]|nr:MULTISPECIES: hypothetical protein [Mesorhizobium]
MAKFKGTGRQGLGLPDGQDARLAVGHGYHYGDQVGINNVALAVSTS